VFRKEDVVISLNYDCVLEAALDLRGKWTPNGGYGCVKHPFVGGRKLLAESSDRAKDARFGHLQERYVWKRASIYVDTPIVNKSFFPRSAQNIDFDLFKAEGPYVIAPSYVKAPKLQIAYLMLDALAQSAKADNLVIIGSALRKEDTFLTLIITRFLHNAPRTRKIIIVDPCADDISEKVKNYWATAASDQIVAIPARLQDSIKPLIQLISMSRKRGLAKAKGRATEAA
jgi:hypothetical protein